MFNLSSSLVAAAFATKRICICICICTEVFFAKWREVYDDLGEIALEERALSVLSHHQVLKQKQKVARQTGGAISLLAQSLGLTTEVCKREQAGG